MKFQLQWILEGGSQSASRAGRKPGASSRSRTAPWSVAIVMTAVGASAIGWVFSNGRRNRAPVVRFRGRASGPRSFPGRPRGYRRTDGHRVQRDRPRGNRNIWLRPLGALEAHPLAGTEGATVLLVAGQPVPRVHRRGKLKKIDANGGPTQNLCDAPVSADGSWNESGVILYDGGRGISRVSASGGVPYKRSMSMRHE